MNGSSNQTQPVNQNAATTRATRALAVSPSKKKRNEKREQFFKTSGLSSSRDAVCNHLEIQPILIE
jgi:hypothetical protein